jgi:hypothetical protein
MSLYKFLWGSLALISVGATNLLAQSSYIPTYTEGSYLLDRIETMNGVLSDDLHLTSGPIHQKDAARYLFGQKSAVYDSKLSNSDMYNINKLMYGQAEWLLHYSGGMMYQKDRNPIKPLYDNATALLEYNSRRFYININPVLGYQFSNERYGDENYPKHLFRIGANMRATWMNKLSVYADITHNTEQLPYNFSRFNNTYEAIPGVGNFTASSGVKPRYQYLLLRGHVDIKVLKDNMNLTLGYGQHKIGDGFRSLMLSNFSEAAFFAKLNTRIWKLKYQNIYTQYEPQTLYMIASSERKYATTHHLSMNVFHWLNVGVFESVVFGRKDGYEIGYLNPIIFYRAVERSMGSPDKIIIGLNAKALPAKQTQLYGQFIINEFTAKEFFGSNGYWANKWGAQLGAKYFDVFNISNLDIQLEANIVRPYTYSSNLKVGNEVLTNYSHYNMGLAHPLGAGLREGIINVQYQPIRKLKFDARLIAYQQTVDSLGAKSNGTNILKSYDNKTAQYGVKVVDPNYHTTVMLGSMNVSYELIPNAYIELGGMYRRENTIGVQSPNNFMIYGGVRLNLARRDYAQF